jgi:hypothetical protein
MRRLEDDPEYGAAFEKLEAMRREARRLEGEINSWLASRVAAVVGPPKIDVQANAMLRGEEPETPPEFASATYQKLLDRRRIVVRAVEIQAAEVERLRYSVGREIAADMLPDYREAIRGAARGLLAALAAQDKAFAILDHLNAGNIPFTAVMQPAFFPPLGRGGERFSALTHWLYDHIRAGYFTKSDVLGWACDIEAETARALSELPNTEAKRHAA